MLDERHSMKLAPTDRDDYFRIQNGFFVNAIWVQGKYLIHIDIILLLMYNRQ